MRNEKLLRWGILCFIAVMVTIAVASGCSRHRRHLAESAKQDSIEQTTSPTIKDLLEWRELERHEKYVDSVYLAIPEDVLIQIYLSKGTDLIPYEVVEEYDKNKNYYEHIAAVMHKNGIEYNTERDDYDFVDSVYVADSIPKIAKPDKPTPNNPNVDRQMQYYPMPNKDSVKRMIIKEVEDSITRYKIQVSNGFLKNNTLFCFFV